MKQVATRANKLANYITAIVLVLVPFQGFLTVWGSSLIGNYTALRLWDDVLLAILMGIACMWLARDADLRAWFMRSLLVQLIIAFAALTILTGCISYAKGEVTGKALAYGLLVDLRFFAWFLAVLLTAQRSSYLHRMWPRLLIIPAALVVIFGALQYTVLPHDFLAHFGYSTATIAPIETINHNSNYIRVQSTLRGANPLGAYVVIVMSALGALFLRGKRKIVCGVLALFALVALYASGSRSAWIGVVLALGIIGWLQVRSRQGRILYGSIALITVIVVTGVYLLLKNNVRLQNEILHTQKNSAVASTSDGAHANALKNGVTDVLRQPLGDGPGTAGPASEYNGTHAPRIAEDYYVQVAQELGWLGLALFISILAIVAIELYEQVPKSRLALIAFASFFGIAFVCLLSHAWEDDTLAFVWWGIVGIALSGGARKRA